MSRPRALPGAVRAARGLLALGALVWLGCGIFAALGGIPSLRAGPMGGWRSRPGRRQPSRRGALGRGNRAAYLFAIATLLSIATLSLTDQVGALDVTALLINLIPLVLLVKKRKRYLGVGAPG